MTIEGSCLCGGVRFEIGQTDGPFEICHCNRCRKVSGSHALATISVPSNKYSMTAGKELISSYAAPILYAPPAYMSYFCSICGSPVPSPEPDGERIEIQAGLLDGDPEIQPDKHIFVEFVPDWDTITDGLPQFKIQELVLARHGQGLPKGFRLRSHYEIENKV